MKVSEAVQALSLATGKPQERRVAILQRDDGHFTFAMEYWYKSEYEGESIAEGWYQFSSEGIFESAELAETAGRFALLQRCKA